MTQSNTAEITAIHNSTSNPSNLSNQEILSKIKTDLVESVPLIELMQSTTLIMPRGESLQFDHMKLQGFSIITNDLIGKLENARLLVDENPDACSSSSELDELIFEAMGLVSFIQIFQVSEKELSNLHSSQLSGLYFVMQRALYCVNESQAIIESCFQSGEPASKDWRDCINLKGILGANALKQNMLERARLLASDCHCAFDFIDCRALYEVTEEGRHSINFSMEQMSGALRVLESIDNRVCEIKRLVIESRSCEEKTHDVCRLADEFLSISNLALKLAPIHIDKGKSLGYSIDFDSSWINGLFCVVNSAIDRTGDIYETINDLCDALSETSKGGGDAVSVVH